MESRFGHDFSRVRIHDGPRAAESARAVSARAYTVGSHVVLDARDVPAPSSGRFGVLAHELAHVIQQGRAAPDATQVVRRQFDPCFWTPFGKVCKSDYEKAKDVLHPKGSSEVCPQGFKTSTSTSFKGLCCKEGTPDSAETCCPSIQITAKAVSPTCCPTGTHPDAAGKTCITPTATLPACPTDRPQSSLFCSCKPPSRMVGFYCCPPGVTTGPCAPVPAPSTAPPAK